MDIVIWIVPTLVCFAILLALRSKKQIVIFTLSIVVSTLLAEAFGPRWLPSVGVRLDMMLPFLRTSTLVFAVARVIGLRINRKRQRYNPVIEFTALAAVVVVFFYFPVLIPGEVIAIWR